jgi:uncharacterized protein YjbJ (UPF0337 family)
MDKDRITGAAKRAKDAKGAKGAVKESVGRLIHAVKMKTAGTAERVAGAAGGAKDAARGGSHGSGP